MNYQRLSIYACGVACIAYAAMLLLKYYSLGYYDWDLAFFTQALWKLQHGSQFVPLVGINYFGDHAYFLSLIVLPFFAVFSSPLILLFFKLAAFIAAGYFLYHYAKAKVGAGAGFWLMLLYFCFPANVFGMLYEYNPESLAPPLVFLTFIALNSKQYTYAMVLAFLMALIKENMFLVSMMFMFYASFVGDYRYRTRFLLAAFLFATIFLYLSVSWVPMNRELTYHSFMVRYANLNPEGILHILTTPINVQYYMALFGVLLLPALLAPLVLAMMLPLLLQHALSLHGPEHTIFYHYGPTMVPFIFVAGVLALQKLHLRWQKPTWVICLAWLLFVLNIAAFQIHYVEEFKGRLNLRPPSIVKHGWNMLDLIPKNEAVVASFEFLAPLSTRDQLYSFHMLCDDAFQNPQKIKRSELYTGKIFQLPSNVRYALINHHDPWLMMIRQQNPTAYHERVHTALHDFKVVKQVGPIVLYKR